MEKNIGICAIIKDCNPNYLREWVEWHQLIGVDYFFIYDNESKIPINEILKPSDKIFVEQIIDNVMQLKAYEDCIKKQKNKQNPTCEWIAFIDDDEFIIPECGDIKKVLKDYEKYSALGINWMIFGSSDLKYLNNEKQILKFNKVYDEKTSNSKININNHVKSIVKPSHVQKIINPHTCKFESKLESRLKKVFSFGLRNKIFKKGLCIDIDENLIIDHAFTKKTIHRKMWIAHYYLKSEEEFKHKINRGRADTLDAEMQLKMNAFYELDNNCTIEYNFIKKLYLKLTK